jgi:HAD domain in Swiss Army Knife RNA repair proteins
MKRRVLFLDIDGVCNSHGFFRERHGGRFRMGDDGGDCPHSWRLDQAMVARVDRACRSARAEVVVISSWRLWMPLGVLRGVLTRAGLSAPVIDGTPKLGSPRTQPRGPEIAAWLAAHWRGLDGYVILDDTDDMGVLASRHVLTSTDQGMTSGDVQAATKLLRAPITAHQWRQIAAVVDGAPRARSYVDKVLKSRSVASAAGARSDES